MDRLQPINHRWKFIGIFPLSLISPPTIGFEDKTKKVTHLSTI